MSTGKIFGWFVVIFVALTILGISLNWFGEAVEVAQDEFGPKAALEKYEWFIDQAQDIEKMDRDVELFTHKLNQVDSTYLDYGKKKDWDMTTRVTYNNDKKQAQNDLLAVKSQRNGLVREYNAASDKFNWKPFQTKPDKPKKRYYELE